jgi:hypothetical protein
MDNYNTYHLYCDSCERVTEHNEYEPDEGDIYNPPIEGGIFCSECDAKYDLEF